MESMLLVLVVLSVCVGPAMSVTAGGPAPAPPAPACTLTNLDSIVSNLQAIAKSLPSNTPTGSCSVGYAYTPGAFTTASFKLTLNQTALYPLPTGNQGDNDGSKLTAWIIDSVKCTAVLWRSNLNLNSDLENYLCSINYGAVVLLLNSGNQNPDLGAFTVQSLTSVLSAQGKQNQIAYSLFLLQKGFPGSTFGVQVMKVGTGVTSSILISGSVNSVQFIQGP